MSLFSYCLTFCYVNLWNCIFNLAYQFNFLGTGNESKYLFYTNVFTTNQIFILLVILGVGSWKTFRKIFSWFKTATKIANSIISLNLYIFEITAIFHVELFGPFEDHIYQTYIKWHCVITLSPSFIILLRNFHATFQPLKDFRNCSTADV